MAKLKIFISPFSLKMDKRGEEESIFSIWWILIMLVVGGGIVMITMSFYSAYSDINPIESEIMAQRVGICISNGVDGFFEKENSLLDSCGLAVNSFENGDLMLKVYIDDVESYAYGNLDFEIQCELRKGLRSAKNFAECSEAVFEYEGREIKIVAGSNTLGEVNKNG